MRLKLGNRQRPCGHKKSGLNFFKLRPEIYLQIYFLNYFAGAGAGAAGAGAGAASGAGAGAAASGAGAGAGASTAGAGAGSSAFLHPKTETDKEATNSMATKMANIFFINGKPPFKDLINVLLV